MGLPDSTLAPLFARLSRGGPPATRRATGPPGTEPPEPIRLVPVTREGEAFAVASGLWLGGRVPVVAIQCTGLMEAGDALRGTAQRMGIPLVILVSWRGHGSMVAAGLVRARPPFDAATLVRPDVDSAALLARPTLDAWCVPAEEMVGTRGGDAPLRAAFDRADLESRPVAVLLARSASR